LHIFNADFTFDSRAVFFRRQSYMSATCPYLAIICFTSPKPGVACPRLRLAYPLLLSSSMVRGCRRFFRAVLRRSCTIAVVSLMFSFIGKPVLQTHRYGTARIVFPRLMNTPILRQSLATSIYARKSFRNKMLKLRLSA
jgi:hypothetical protein